MEDEGVPVEARRDEEVDVVRAGGGADGEGEGEVQDEAGEATVGDKEVGAAAQGKEAEVVSFGESDGFEELVLGSDYDEEPGRATYAERSEGGEADVFLDFEVKAGHGLRVQQRCCVTSGRGRP